MQGRSHPQRWNLNDWEKSKALFSLQHGCYRLPIPSHSSSFSSYHCHQSTSHTHTCAFCNMTWETLRGDRIYNWKLCKGQRSSGWSALAWTRMFCIHLDNLLLLPEAAGRLLLSTLSISLLLSSSNFHLYISVCMPNHNNQLSEQHLTISYLFLTYSLMSFVLACWSITRRFCVWYHLRSNIHAASRFLGCHQLPYFTRALRGFGLVTYQAITRYLNRDPIRLGQITKDDIYLGEGVRLNKDRQDAEIIDYHGNFRQDNRPARKAITTTYTN